MLEIFILFKLGRTISSKAKEKGWPGWPFAVIMIFLYLGGAVAGVITAAIIVATLLNPDPNVNGGDDIAEFIIGYFCGAVLGALASYLLVLILPDRSEPENDDDYDESSDRREQREQREPDEPRRFSDQNEDRKLPRAKRASEADDDKDGRWKRY